MSFRFMSAKPAVLVTRNSVAPSAIERLRRYCDVDLHDAAEAMSRSELLSRTRGKHGLVTLITDDIDQGVIEAGEHLRVIANVAVGYNNIDVSVARARGICVTNTPDVLTNAVADFTWALLLAVVRRIREADRYVRAGQWTAFSFDLLPGMELDGKQLGVVGFGRIGAAVAARGQSFGMRIAFTARGAVDPALGKMELAELLATSDIVSLHVPLTTQTRRLIDAAALSRMKRTAYLINTSRGPVVDETALADALENGRIAGAALDVFEDEPRVSSRLLKLENVVLSPHIGSGTVETRTAMSELAVDNVLAVLGGKPPLTPVP